MPRTGLTALEIKNKAVDATMVKMRQVGFDKVRLGPGESKVIAVSIDPKFLSVFDVAKDAWELLPGDYTIQAGPSSRDLPLTTTLRIGSGQ